MARLDGTTALVTGASSGIGEATAVALAAEGARLVLVARRRDRLEVLAARIGGDAVVVEADVTDPAQAAAAVERAVAETGRLDVVVNNAGVMLLGPAVEAPLEEWDRMVAVNVQAVLHVTHATLPHLLEAAGTAPRGVSDLVTISSTAGRAARSGSGVYNLTKFGVGAFAEALRQEVTRRHLRVGLVEPGATATELRSHLREPQRTAQEERFRTMEPLQATDVAEAVVYMVTRDRRTAISEITIRPTEQES
ncbi:SDR family NAD(P)-dependent oxidoreductase [Amnibacterium kyonggiense]|uniref:NADP-dependent 3-hydroxy acid dehydrogenase YdfG n=1 Tax=Amnibacterium kyonggiense TaxID=595671 RepID=A0A4V3EAL4_9MICO|nr:SDR family NAD(P)-dependent oxidoreductase [Amnibacterium kyonggiense]TDS77114.1 NADP-dependent 3-hydroxy acid dehydrogenase YdfG [Amnibacterium kyonggiense]